jgi:hypothetical protein
MPLHGWGCLNRMRLPNAEVLRENVGIYATKPFEKGGLGGIFNTHLNTLPLLTSFNHLNTHMKHLFHRDLCDILNTRD